MDLLNKEEITQFFCLLLAKNGRQIEIEYSEKSEKYMVWWMERSPDTAATEDIESKRIPLDLVDTFSEAQEAAWKWIQQEDDPT